MLKMRIWKLCVWLMAILAIGGTASCSKGNDAKQKTEHVEADNGPIKETTKLTGTVANAKVEMTLHCVGSNITGNYHYMKYPNDGLTLSGTLDHNGHLKMKEIGDNNESTGSFDGYYSPTKGYKGVFTAADGKMSIFLINVNSVKPTE